MSPSEESFCSVTTLPSSLPDFSISFSLWVLGGCLSTKPLLIHMNIYFQGLPEDLCLGKSCSIKFVSFSLLLFLQIPYLGFCSCEELGETGIWQLRDPPILPLTHGPTGGFNWRETLLQE